MVTRPGPLTSEDARRPHHCGPLLTPLRPAERPRRSDRVLPPPGPPTGGCQREPGCGGRHPSTNCSGCRRCGPSSVPSDEPARMSPFLARFGRLGASQLIRCRDAARKLPDRLVAGTRHVYRNDPVSRLTVTALGTGLGNGDRFRWPGTFRPNRSDVWRASG